MVVGDFFELINNAIFLVSLFEYLIASWVENRGGDPTTTLSEVNFRAN